MRLLTRGLILIVSFLVLFGLFILFTEYWEAREAEHLISELRSKEIIIIESQLKLKNEPVSMYVQDLTVYDETVDFFNSRSRKFLADNIDSSSEVYNIGEVWLYSPDFKKVYYFQNKNVGDEAGDIDDLIPSLKKRLSTERLFSFYYRKNNIIYNMIAASIHPTEDMGRKSKPAGYLITAVPYNTAFLNGIRSDFPMIQNVSTIFEIVQPVSRPTLLTVQMPLADINGEPAAYLNVDNNSQYIDDVNRADTIQRYFVYLIILFAAAIITAFIHGVIRPLKEIYRALFEVNYAAPKNHKHYSFEFKRIMEMININKSVELKLGKALAENEKQMEIIERAVKTKSEFIANISHEIRTPLTGVIGFGDMLLETQLDSQQRYYAEGIKKSSDHVLNIINDILDLSKIEAGKFELLYKPFNIGEMLNDVIFILKGYAIDTGLVIKFENSIPDCVSVEGDEKRLRQILLNLGGNAIKYTLQGEVKITAASALTDTGSIKLTFEIIDTGVGMTDEQISRIFDKYEQIHDPVTFTGGSGLGLTITKSLAELMNGTLKVKSVPGSGSVFTVILEMIRFNGEIEKRLPAQVKDLDLNILIAEDNLINMRVLENILKKAGCRCDICNNGQKAVEMAEQNKYDLILLDFQMPVLDGRKAALKIRTGNGPNKRSMIYAISADMAEDSKIKSGKSRMNGFIMKPFVVEEIHAILLNIKNNLKIKA